MTDICFVSINSCASGLPARRGNLTRGFEPPSIPTTIGSPGYRVGFASISQSPAKPSYQRTEEQAVKCHERHLKQDHGIVAADWDCTPYDSLLFYF
jgi:hypothetical protein